MPTVRVLIVCFLGSVWSAIAIGQERAAFSTPEERRERIRFIIEATGESERTEKLAEQTIAGFRKRCPGISDASWESILKTLKADMIKANESVYEQHYSDEDLAALVAVFKSAVWQKTRSLRPEIARESRVLGQQVGKRLDDELKAKGCELRPAPPTPTS